MAESGEGAVASAVPSDRADAALLIGLMVEQPVPAAAAKKQKKAEERFTPELALQLRDHQARPRPAAQRTTPRHNAARHSTAHHGTS